MLSKKNITALMLKRQYFTKKADKDEYLTLFRDMQPVPTEYWCSPGDPPKIYHRPDFDDYKFNFKRRQDREIVKGRFQMGSVGYICADELELFAGLYKKPIERHTEEQNIILDLLSKEGPMNIQLIKELTGMLVKEITPELHKLQQAFLVYEDQVDNDWDRGWYLFSTEFNEIDIDRYDRVNSLCIVLPRFLRLNVFANEDMIRSFYKLPLKDIKKALDILVSRGECIHVVIEQTPGYILKRDYNLLLEQDFLLGKSVYVLHRSDFLVKCHEFYLKDRFKDSEFGLLQHILIDGEFKGGIMGKFKFGPPIIEDIVLDISKEDKIQRKDEIINAVYTVNNKKDSPFRRYCGKE